MIVQANSFRIPLQDNSVHCVITSPPYFGLRDYGLKPLVFGGRADCQHEWISQRHNPNPHGDDGQTNSGLQGGKTTQTQTGMGEIESAFCRHCQAWLGSYGLEPTISLFCQHTVEVCREIKRVLRDDGVFFLNIGDSYATGKNGRSAADGKALGSDDRTFRDKPFSITEIPAKNLCLIPQRVVIALQEDGWIVRSAPPWIKKNSMPESVQDRPGTGHEYIYMLVKSARYWWDATAVRKANATIGDRREGKGRQSYNGKWDGSGKEQQAFVTINPAGRALRTSDFFFDSLDATIAHLTAIRDSGGLLLDGDGGPGAFVVNPRGYKFAHYATFPLALVEPMIKASAPDKCCPKCGKGWVRVTEPTPEYAKHLGKDWADYEQDATEGRGHAVSGQRPAKRNGASLTASYKTTGFRPGCTCYRTHNEAKRRRQDMRQRLYDLLVEFVNDEEKPAPLRSVVIVKAAEMRPYLWSARVAQNRTAPTIPGIVLDPFAGSGTVGEVCRRLGRRFIGLDLSPKYLQENALPRAEKLTSEKALSQLPLFANLQPNGKH